MVKFQLIFMVSQSISMLPLLQKKTLTATFKNGLRDGHDLYPPQLMPIIIRDGHFY